jgi:hypothetical protein
VFRGLRHLTFELTILILSRASSSGRRDVAPRRTRRRFVLLIADTFHKSDAYFKDISRASIAAAHVGACVSAGSATVTGWKSGCGVFLSPSLFVASFAATF